MINNTDFFNKQSSISHYLEPVDSFENLLFFFIVNRTDRQQEVSTIQPTTHKVNHILPSGKNSSSKVLLGPHETVKLQPESAHGYLRDFIQFVITGGLVLLNESLEIRSLQKFGFEDFAASTGAVESALVVVAFVLFLD